MSADLASLTGPVAAMDPRSLDRLLSLGTERTYPAGTALITVDQPAEEFYIITSGKVQVGLRRTGRDGIVIQTLGPGEMAGLSWYAPPYRWNWDVTAAVDTDVLALEAAEVREVCDQDAGFRAAILKVIVTEMHQRLVHTRLQLLDVYRQPGGAR